MLYHHHHHKSNFMSLLGVLLAVGFGISIGRVDAASLSCENYGTVNSSTTCACPPGFGGPTCDLLACGGTLFQGSSRSLAQSQGNAPSNFSTCACEDGWTGAGCNICTTPNACQAAFTSIQPTNSNGQEIPQIPSTFQNQTMTCNSKPRVFAASQMSCDVINPTLQAVFPGTSNLNIMRTLNSTLSPVPGATSFGPNGSIYAQFFYEGVEEFFCNANNCTQDVSDGSDWKCQNLQCTCKPGTLFCGGNPNLDLTAIINGLNGELDINCGGGGGSSSNSECVFQQSTLETLFGKSGLALTDCKFGECVRQFAIDDALNANSTSNNTSGGSGGGGKDLSGGVIAGLAVVGTLLLLAIAFLVIGKILQLRARKNGPKTVRQGGIGIRWENVGYMVPVNYGTFSLKSTRRKRRDDVEGNNNAPAGFKAVLDPNTSRGTVRPGQMLAILGPSGAGKTSLIDILAGKRKIGKITGKVEFFDQNGNIVKNPKIGFVDQADTLPHHLTPREYFRFVASLRLSESISNSVKEERVSRVLDQLGLTHVADVRIGNGERRGISGGEMRRVSLGCELIAGCDVIVLDEPTSGLDSVSAAKVANVLQSIATDPENPTAVIASIHQPNSKLYMSFSDVLVLSKGHTLYSGPGRLEPVRALTAQGEAPCPEGYNIADWLLDIASEGRDRQSTVIASSTSTNFQPNTSELLNRRTNDNHTATAAAAVNTTLSVPGVDEPEPDSNINNNNNSQEKFVVDETASRTKIEKDGSSVVSGSGSNSSFGGRWRGRRYATSYMTQFEVLAWREWLNLKRDKTLLITHLAFACVLGVFVGGLYFQTGITIAGFQARVGCLFFVGALIAFTTISALYNLVEIRPLFLRERAAGYYSPVAWLLSRIVFDLIPLRLIPTIILSIIVYWMAGLSHSAAHFFKFLLIVVLYCITMTLFNFLLACVFRNGGIAVLISALTALYQQTYAGFFVHLGSIPPVLRWLQWLCPLKYALEALSINEVSSGLMISDTLEGVPVNVSAVLILDLLFGFSSDNYYRDVLVLFAFIAGFGILVILAVWYNVRERR